MQNRRTFIKKSGLFLASTTLINPYLACAKEKKKLGVALVGLGGYSSGQLAPALKLTKNIELRGIVTGSPNKIPSWQKEHNIPDVNVYSYDNMGELANNDAIDVVYIVTPTFTHAKFAIAAAQAGKHVFCEKPMAMTIAECQSIIDACEKNDVKLAIGYRMQHEKNTQQLMEWAKTKPYGDIKSIETAAGFRIGKEGGWRLDGAKGGGAIYDMGVYPINGARYAAGMEPTSVSARHQDQRPELFTNGASEITHFDLEFPEGVVAKGSVSYAERSNLLKVNCVNGGYELSPFQSYTGVSGTTTDGKILDSCNCDQQAIQMDNDAISILENRPMRAPGIEGLRDIRIVEAILRSAQEQSSIIML